MTTIVDLETGAPSTGHPFRAWDYISLNIYWFALSFLWNSMGPILLPTLVPLLVPESQKGSALGLLSALGLVIAIFVQPAAGAWSDSHVTRWGRRRPYIVGGTMLDVVFLLAMAFAPSYLMLLVAYLLLQFSSNIAHGAYQGYIPELVPEARRGAVSGMARLLEIIGIIITSLAAGELVGRGQILEAFIAIIFCLLFSMILTAIFVNERPFDGAVGTDQQAAAHRTETPAHPLTEEAGLSGLLRAVFCSRDFTLWLISRLLILLGGNLVRNYVLYFLGDVLGVENPAASVGTLLAVIAVAIAVVVYPSGVLSDRWGRKSLTVLSGLLGALGALLLIAATNLTLVLVDGGLIGISLGIFLSVSWAWGTDLIPAEEGGRYLGVSNIATAGSGVLAGIGGFMLDYFNARSHNLGYTALFLSAVICYLLGTAIAIGVRDRKRRERAQSIAGT